MKSLILIGLLLFSGIRSFAQTPLYLFGGGKRDFTAMKSLAAEKQNPKILIITWSTSKPAATFEEIQADFHLQGVQDIEHAVEVRNDRTRRVFLEQVRDANILFFSGGAQNKALDIIDHFDLRSFLLDCFEKGTVLAGTSAGTALMPEIAITGDVKKGGSSLKSTHHRPGLGATSFLVDQHFLARPERYIRLVRLLQEFPERIALGVAEDSSARIFQDEIKLFGSSPLTVLKMSSDHKEVLRQNVYGSYSLAKTSCRDYF